MASKLWRYGKKLTVWGALVFLLPFLFLPLMVVSGLGVAFAVPSACAVATYICFRKIYGALFRKRAIKNEAVVSYGISELEVSFNGDYSLGDENQGIADRAFETDDQRVQEPEEIQSERAEGLNGKDHHGKAETFEEEKPQQKVDEAKPIEEENHRPKLHEAETQSMEGPEDIPAAEEEHTLEDEAQSSLEAELKRDPHAIPVEKTAAEEKVDEAKPIEEENHRLKFHEAETQSMGGPEDIPAAEEEHTHEDEAQSSLEAQLKRDPHAIPVEKIAAEEPQDSENESQSSAKDEGKASEGEAQLKPGPQATTPMEKTEETSEDETRFGLEEEVKASQGEPELTSVENLSFAGNKDKGREEEEEEESNEMQEISSEKYQHEQPVELDSVPSTLYTGKEVNLVSPEPSYCSAQQSLQSESPAGASSMGFEFDEDSIDNEATDIEITPSLEVQVSSGSGTDQDFKSVSAGIVEEDLDNDGKIWEEINSVRKIVGYKEEPYPSYAEEIKALYVFTGVEPPASLKDSSDLLKVKEKLKHLKVVLGVK